MLARIFVCPPRRPFAWISSGGHPVPSMDVTFPPSCVTASMRSCIGRSRIRATPSRVTTPFPAAMAGVMNRAVVPELPTNRLADGMSKACPSPTTVSVSASGCALIVTPSCRRQSIIRSVSSQKSALRRTVVPCARADRRRALLVMLLLPGTETTLMMGCWQDLA